MNNISDLSIIDKTIKVEPGVVLSELNRYLKPHGLMFAPNISTADRATIGGMIATDAAGKGSLIYGKTSDHVKSINTVLINGEIHEFNELNSNNLTSIRNAIPEESVIPAKAGIHTSFNTIHQKIKELLIPVQNEIDKIFPDLKRPLSGYNLRQCLTSDTLDITRLISGSEGTLCFITGATLKLVEIPKYKSLVVVHYDSFLESLSDARFLINYTPMAIEAVDDKVQKSAESLPNWLEIAKLLNTEGRVSISNFVEFAESNEKHLQEKVDKLVGELTARNSRFAVINNLADINKLWGVRSLAVGLAANVRGMRKPIAFVEDAIVPPHNLHAFVKDLEEYLDSLNLNYAMYGHVDVGCIHVRPALNMQDEKDKALIRPITMKTLELTDKYQGLLWGEHGKGVRGEFVKHTFGDILYQVMVEIKALFDPKNRLNPGKLVNSDGDMAKISKIDGLPIRGDFDKLVDNTIQDEYLSAFLCNGNGSCFNREASNVMCPSYKVTHNRIHSPKGRATLVKEWLRHIATKDSAAEKAMAHEVFATMKECLGCKSCSGKCPVKVSIPDLKTKFLDQYHKKYKKRTLQEFATGHLEHILNIAKSMPRFWNFMVRNKLMPSMGMIDIPMFSSEKTFKKELVNQNILVYKTPTDLKSATKPIVIIADVFSSLLDQNVLFASVQVLSKLGYTPYVLEPRVSGKALLVAGFLDKFKTNANVWHGILNPIFALNIPVIGLENSITLIFRDEFAKFYKPLNGKVETLAEVLAKSDINMKNIIAQNDNNKHLRNNHNNNTTKPDLNQITSSTTLSYTLLPHCTEQALQAIDAKHWENIFKSFDLNLSSMAIGCCGMAGTYGHEKDHLENSRKLFDMHWQPTLNNQVSEYLATGYSCRSQTKRITGKKLLHPIEIIAKNL